MKIGLLIALVVRWYFKTCSFRGADAGSRGWAFVSSDSFEAYQLYGREIIIALSHPFCITFV